MRALRRGAGPLLLSARPRRAAATLTATDVERIRTVTGWRWKRFLEHEPLEAEEALAYEARDPATAATSGPPPCAGACGPSVEPASSWGRTGARSRPRLGPPPACCTPSSPASTAGHSPWSARARWSSRRRVASHAASRRGGPEPGSAPPWLHDRPRGLDCADRSLAGRGAAHPQPVGFVKSREGRSVPDAADALGPYACPGPAAVDCFSSA
jgi:hypothetical protein